MSNRRATLLILAMCLVSVAILLRWGGSGWSQTVPFNYNNFIFFGNPCSAIVPPTPPPAFAECFNTTNGAPYYWSTSAKAFLQVAPTATPT